MFAPELTFTGIMSDRTFASTTVLVGELKQCFGSLGGGMSFASILCAVDAFSARINVVAPNA